MSKLGKMKEMVYKNRLGYKKLLDHDEYKGIEYYILSMGTHPCAYINLPSKNKDKITSLINNMCHGGITFNGNILDIGFDEVRGDFVGWDYAHLCDYVSGINVFDDFPFEKKWTTEEILGEIKEIIDAIVSRFGDFQDKNASKIQITIEKLADDLKRKAPLIASDIKDVEGIDISAKIRYNEVLGWKIEKKYASKDNDGTYIALTSKDD